MSTPSVPRDPVAEDARPGNPPGPDASATRPPAGRALSEPSRAGVPPSLYDYGLIGNERTAALVSHDGSVDWACFPRFDSPSVFGRLLDRAAGGFHRIAPEGRYASHQQYIGGTNLLSTLFEIRGGVLLGLTDFMPVGPSVSADEGEPRIVRRLVARGGPIPARITADVRLNYALEPAEWELRDQVALARGPSGQVALTAPWPWQLDHGVAVASGTVAPGQPLFAQVRWGEPPPADPSPAKLLAVTDAYWRAWVSPEDAPLRRVAARWHPWVERSELVLKLLSYGTTGVFVAAPTTSLPEWPGGSRNWDYRYVWIRDAAFTAQVFLLLGHVVEARAYVGWAFDRVAALGENDEVPTIYSVDGARPPPERDYDHLEGYLGSKPIRVGNAAAGQRQLDVYGEILDSALLLEHVDPAFVRDRWATIEWLAQRTTELWSEPDRGIWEFRGQPSHFVHSKLMCWVALDRSIQLAHAFGRTEKVDRWKRVADEIRGAILSRGYDDQRETFVQAFDRPVLDASSLRIPITGFLPPTDPRVLRTIAALEKDLGQGPFLRRYDGDDGQSGPEGSFLLCAFWLVESLARCGQADRALTNWRALLDSAGPLLLFSEEYDPVASMPLGNYPQAFTHIGVLRAALALGLVGSDR
jgi:GH15 family glucan-1,4-alpha-glucosidase